MIFLVIFSYRAGMALGDYLLSNIWGILSILTNTPLYQFFP